jgi:protein SCO1/2
LWSVAAICVILATGSVYWAYAQTSKHSSLPANAWFNGLTWQRGSTVNGAPNFRIPDQNRRPVSLHQFRGRVTFISFTSSVCTQQCALVGRALATVERSLGPLAKHTAMVSISVDPEADTRATVNHFARIMGWKGYSWYYLWEPRRLLQPVWASYYVNVPTPSPNLKSGANVVHDATVVMVDGSGLIRAYLPWPFRASGLERGARTLIAANG